MLEELKTIRSHELTEEKVALVRKHAILAQKHGRHLVEEGKSLQKREVVTDDVAQSLRASGRKIQELAKASLVAVETAQAQEGEEAYQSLKLAEDKQLKASQEYVKAIKERTKVFQEQIETNREQ